MECKSQSCLSIITGCVRINRNIVECKLGLQYLLMLSPLYELIETLWNVNASGSSQNLTRTEELIETLWNVNFNKSIILSDGFMN